MCSAVVLRLTVSKSIEYSVRKMKSSTRGVATCVFVLVCLSEIDDTIYMIKKIEQDQIMILSI